jgi:hypothetical protein
LGKILFRQNHDYLSATVPTQEGGFLLAGTSYSGKGLDKKMVPKVAQTSGSLGLMNLEMNYGKKRWAPLQMKKPEL